MISTGFDTLFYTRGCVIVRSSMFSWRDHVRVDFPTRHGAMVFVELRWEKNTGSWRCATVERRARCTAVYTVSVMNHRVVAPSVEDKTKSICRVEQRGAALKVVASRYAASRAGPGGRRSNERQSMREEGRCTQRLCMLVYGIYS